MFIVKKLTFFKFLKVFMIEGIVEKEFFEKKLMVCKFNYNFEIELAETHPEKPVKIASVWYKKHSLTSKSH